MSLRIECPRCERLNVVNEASMGCYVPCEACHARFYVPVPPLDAGTPQLFTPPTANIPQPDGHGPTLNDLLRDTQEGQGALLKILRRQDQFLNELRRELTVIRRVAVIGMVLLLLLIAHSLFQFTRTWF